MASRSINDEKHLWKFKVMDISKGFLRVRSSNSTSPSASVVAVVLLLSFNSIFVFTSADDSAGTLPPIFLPYSNIILYSHPSTNTFFVAGRKPRYVKFALCES